MITMSKEQLDKIELLDRLFGSIGVEQLKEFVDSEQVVARLKGTESNPGLLMGLIRDRDMAQLETMNVKSELSALKSDFQLLLKVLHADVFTPRFNMDFNNLKSKHNVY